MFYLDIFIYLFALGSKGPWTHRRQNYGYCPAAPEYYQLVLSILLMT